METGKLIMKMDASKRVKEFVSREKLRTARTEEKELVVGHYFDLKTMKEFMAGIERLNRTSPGAVTGVTVYFGKTENAERLIREDDTDIIIVPSKNKVDIYNVYTPIKSLDYDLILGDGSPCPNVCPGGGLDSLVC